MNDDYPVYALRCARCLWSVLGTEPRELAARFGEHSCDPADIAYLTAVRLLNHMVNDNGGD